MKTENLFDVTLKEIEPFLKSLKKEKWVKGIVLLGGIGKRKFIDRFSDIDLSVVISKKDKKQFPLPFEFHYFINNKILEFNIHQLILEDEKKRKWDEGKKEAYSRALIYFDPDNEISDLINNKTKYEKEDHYNKLIWIIQQYKWRGQIHSVRACKRGFPEVAHNLLNECIDFLVEAVYIINERYLPHKKWRMAYIKEMENIKPIHSLLKKAIIVKENSITDVNHRIRILNEVFKKIYSLVLKKYPDFPKNPYEFYYRNFVQINPKTSIDSILNLINPKEEDFEKIKGILCYNLLYSKKKLLRSPLYNKLIKNLE